MSTRKYILVGEDPVQEHDLRTWAAWFETSEQQRTIAVSQLPGVVQVSTVFLSLEPPGDADGHMPRLFETRVFGGPQDGEYLRCSTWTGARVQHSIMLERLQAPARADAKDAARYRYLRQQLQFRPDLFRLNVQLPRVASLELNLLQQFDGAIDDAIARQT